MATLILEQPNASQLFAVYSSNYAYIEETPDGWSVLDRDSGTIYGVFLGTGITYSTSGSPLLGTITEASRLDDSGLVPSFRNISDNLYEQRLANVSPAKRLCQGFIEELNKSKDTLIQNLS